MYSINPRIMWRLNIVDDIICTERNLIHYNRMTGKQNIKIFSRIALVKYRFSLGTVRSWFAKGKMRNDCKGFSLSYSSLR